MNAEDMGNMFLQKMRYELICSIEFTPLLWLTGSAGLHTHSPHPHQLSLDTVQYRFYMISEPASFEELAHMCTRAHIRGCLCSDTKSVSFFLQRAWTPTGKRPHLKRWKAWIIWSKVNWLHHAVFFPENTASNTKDFVFVWERLRACPHVSV